MALTGYNVFAFNAYTFWGTHQDATEVYLPDILHWYVDALSARLNHQCKLVWSGTASGFTWPIIDESGWTSAYNVYVLLSDMQGEEPNFVNSLNPNGEDIFLALALQTAGVATDNFVSIQGLNGVIRFEPMIIRIFSDSNSNKFIQTGGSYPANSVFDEALLSNGTEVYKPNNYFPFFGKLDNNSSDTYAVNQNQAKVYIQKTSFGFIGGIVSGQKGHRIDWDKYDEYGMIAGGIVLELYNKADPTDRKWCMIRTDSSSGVTIGYPARTSGTKKITTVPGLLKSQNTSVVKLIPFSMGYYVNDDFYIIPVSQASDGNNAIYDYARGEKDYIMKKAIQVGSDHYTLIRYITYSQVNTPLLCVKNGEQC